MLPTIFGSIYMKYYHVSITLTHKLSAICFGLYKIKDNYYLATCKGFMVSSVPSNNKDWKEHFFLIDISRD